MTILRKWVMLIVTALLIFSGLAGCQRGADPGQAAAEDVKETVVMNKDGTYGTDYSYKKEKGLQAIYFAGGCFWGMEKLFSGVPGVTDVTSGYANGHVDNPTYQQVCSNATGFRETVRVTYDPGQVSLPTLLEIYFAIIDPTVRNRQGNDVGSQYQTGIYYREADSEAIVQAAAEKERAQRPVFEVEIKPLINFYDAEAYHQDYLEKNPTGYCHITPKDFAKALQIAEAAKNK
jgi:peptide methionine sulfoxide reductase msrA/msrB